MIAQFFPKGFPRYLSLPVLGSVMNRFATWLQDQQYTWRSSRFELRMAAHVCRYLKRRAVSQIEDLGQQHLESCHRLFRRKYPDEAGSVLVLAKFLAECGYVPKLAPPPPSATQIQLNAFMVHLRDVRGYAPSTVRRQVETAAEFLDSLDFKSSTHGLSRLNSEDIERFTHRLAKRMGRVAMQKPIASLRNLLRFWIAAGIIPPGLDCEIDTPRVYRQERLPRALPWPTVQAFLRSINRDLAIGKRDYAMFSLMTTYGLRACDVVALKLDDIQWRAGHIRICQGKTSSFLDLPLTDAVGSAILDYLRNVPRYGAYRHVFLRLKAPGGILKSTAVIEAFQAWSKRSCLDIPFKGVHCLRHSYALYLLRNGLPVKTIGDMLGHQSAESTTGYLRLAIDDLRTVGLHLPASFKHREEE